MVDINIDNIKLGPPEEADHLHKFRQTDEKGDHVLVTIVCKTRDCYAIVDGLDRLKFPPGVIGRKMYWIKKDAQ